MAVLKFEFLLPKMENFYLGQLKYLADFTYLLCLCKIY